MKKIFYILVSAIVALGAVACDNQDLDNIAPSAKGEGLTISATIDEATKVVFEGMQATGWETGDFITINDFQFDYVAEENKFRCETEGVMELVGKSYSATANALNSEAGIKGATFVSTAEAVIDQDVAFTFKLNSALLKYTTTAEVSFEGTALSGEFTDVTKVGETKYIAVKAGENVTFSYSVGDVQCKSLEKNFEAGKVYNLGTLYAPAKIWMRGDWDAWANPLLMYVEGDYYVARNVKIAANEGFKFHDGTKYLGGASTTNVWNPFNGNDIELAAGTYDIYISKTNGVWCAVTAGNAAPTLNKRYLYLDPALWNQGEAKFQAWCMGGSGNTDKDIVWAFNENGVAYFILDISAGYTSFYIKRKSSDGSTVWDEVGPVTIGTNSLITITDWKAYKLGSLVP